MNVDSFTFNPDSFEEMETEIKGSIPRRPQLSRIYRQRFLRMILIILNNVLNLYRKYLVIALEVPLFVSS